MYVCLCLFKENTTIFLQVEYNTRVLLTMYIIIGEL